MAATGAVAHTGPDGDTVADRFQRLSGTCAAANRSTTGAENLLRVTLRREPVDTDALADRIVSRWLASDSHRARIEDPAWRSQGIGVTVTEEDGATVAYVTQNVC